MPVPARSASLLVIACLVVGVAVAAPPAKPPVDPLSALVGAGSTEEALAGKLRGFLLANLPDPLFEDARKWNQQKVNRRGQTVNHGRWQKVRVNGRNLRDTLILDLRSVDTSVKGKTTFTAYLAFDAAVTLDRQNWKSGVRIYSGSTRARMRVRLTIDCEATSRTEKMKDAVVPDVLFRLRVTRSDLKYDNLVVEHTAGIGGDGARVLGDMMLGVVNLVRPNLERDLLAKANAAVVKAADTKEVRLSLMDLLNGKVDLKKKGAAKSPMAVSSPSSSAAGPPGAVERR